MTLFAFRGGPKPLRSGLPHRCFVCLHPFDCTSRKAPSLHDLLHVFHVHVHLVAGLKRSLHVQCLLVQSHPQGFCVWAVCVCVCVCVFLSVYFFRKDLACFLSSMA